MPLLMSLAGGVLLGLASSLHCAAMCSGIATSLMLSAPSSGPQAYRALVLTHLGRISSYMLAGAAVGAAGASMIGWLDREVAFRLLQWGGAVALMWIGLSTAGVLPGPSWLDRVLSPLSHRIARLAGRRPAPFFAGLAWGMMPCAMVYGALFTAMLTGSAAGGITVMAGFGAGTLPGLVLTTLGIRALVRAEMRSELRMLAGFAIALFGFATVWVPHPTLAALCLPS